VGDVLLAVNPYRRLQIYGPTVKAKFNPSEPPVPYPHVYGIAQAAIRNLRLMNKNQCCLISGESGAGKTESAKYFVNLVLQYSLHNGGAGGAMTGDSGELERKIIESGPVLEAFGNAATSLNDNSSRFGK
jgi:myosin-3